MWRQRWDALEVPQKKEEEVLTLIAHASDSVRARVPRFLVVIDDLLMRTS